MTFFGPLPFGIPIVLALLVTFGGFYIPARFEISSLNAKVAGQTVKIANAKADAAKAVSAYDGLTESSQRAVADALKQVSDENSRAAVQSRKDAAVISGLQAQLAQEQIAHIQISAKLSAELNRAKANGNPLSPAVLAYLDELRKYDINAVVPTAPGGSASAGSGPQ